MTGSCAGDYSLPLSEAIDVFAPVRADFLTGVQPAGPHACSSRIASLWSAMAQSPSPLGLAAVVVRSGELGIIRQYGATYWPPPAIGGGW